VEGLGDLAYPRICLEHRRRTGMVFQSHELIGRQTALANVLQGRLGYHPSLRTVFPLSSGEVRLALHCLERVGMLRLAQSRVDRLSGGERQRVGIARALAQEPRLLLADEPVASLDPTNAERVLALLRHICREDGLTAAMSLHQVNYARKFADRVIGLRQGSVVFDGPPGALTQDVLSEIYLGSESPPRAESPEGGGPDASEAPIQEAR